MHRQKTVKSNEELADPSKTVRDNTTQFQAERVK